MAYLDKDVFTTLFILDKKVIIYCSFYFQIQKCLFIILFILAFAEALGGAATGENDSFTKGIVYDNDNNITDNFPNEFVLAANVDGEPHDKDFNAKCNQARNEKKYCFTENSGVSFGGAFENVETIGNKGKGYGNDPGPNCGWNSFNLEDFGEDIEANKVDDCREDAENKIQYNMLIVINKTFEIRW